MSPYTALALLGAAQGAFTALFLFAATWRALWLRPEDHFHIVDGGR